jgi:hypothetical protein
VLARKIKNKKPKVRKNHSQKKASTKIGNKNAENIQSR